jgi:hypothetical protein
VLTRERRLFVVRSATARPGADPTELARDLDRPADLRRLAIVAVAVGGPTRGRHALQRALDAAPVGQVDRLRAEPPLGGADEATRVRVEAELR